MIPWESWRHLLPQCRARRISELLIPRVAFHSRRKIRSRRSQELGTNRFLRSNHRVLAKPRISPFGQSTLVCFLAWFKSVRQQEFRNQQKVQQYQDKIDMGRLPLPKLPMPSSRKSECLGLPEKEWKGCNRQPWDALDTYIFFTQLQLPKPHDSQRELHHTTAI